MANDTVMSAMLSGVVVVANNVLRAIAKTMIRKRRCGWGVASRAVTKERKAGGGDRIHLRPSFFQSETFPFHRSFQDQ